jgi:hypothetical protein
MAKLTDADGPELVRLLNALTDYAHSSLVTHIDIHYRTQLIGGPDPKEADHGWSVGMGVLGGDPKLTAVPALVDALRLMVTQLADEQRQREINASARPAKRTRKR